MVSLKLDLNKKEVLLNEKDCELEVAQVELADANVKALDMKREIDAKMKHLTQPLPKLIH